MPSFTTIAEMLTTCSQRMMTAVLILCSIIAVSAAAIQQDDEPIHNDGSNKYNVGKRFLSAIRSRPMTNEYVLMDECIGFTLIGHGLTWYNRDDRKSVLLG